MLESKEITKAFGKKIAVNHISLRLEPGHIYAMLGPNGSGKTTWMKMAAGLIKPTSGQMLYKDRSVDVESRKEIAYMSTEPYFYKWMSAADVGKYYQDFFEDFSMDAYRSLLVRLELTEDLKTKNLSSGMMAKLKLAVTIARSAHVIMLDEPLNGIDLVARDEIMRCIVETAAPDRILLVSSHLVEELETVADSAIFIKQGDLIDVCELETLRMREGISVADKYRQIFGGGMHGGYGAGMNAGNGGSFGAGTNAGNGGYGAGTNAGSGGYGGSFDAGTNAGNGTGSGSGNGFGGNGGDYR